MNLDEFIKDRKNIYIFGAGLNGERLKLVLREKKRVSSGYMDNSEKLWNNRRGSNRIMKPKLTDGAVIISCLAHANAVKKQLLELGYADDDIYIADKEELFPVHYCMDDEHFCYHQPVKNGLFEPFVVKNKNHKYEKWIKQHRITDVKPKKYKVSICNVFHNEGAYLKEWLDYHLMVGVEHFYMYDNLSTDNYKEILTPYIDSGIVTLESWELNPRVSDFFADWMSKYSDETEWIGVIDPDEFVCPVNYDSIGEFLDTKKEYGSVLIHWRVFGSSGLKERDVHRSVLKDFTSCWPRLSDVGKCFWNTMYPIYIEEGKMTSFHITRTQCAGKAMLPVDAAGNFCEWGQKLLGNSRQGIQLNHYIIKSEAEYEEKKRRPDTKVEFAAHEKEQFEWHDNRCSATDTSILEWMEKHKGNN